jgi:hypothetical protein
LANNRAPGVAQHDFASGALSAFALGIQMPEPAE